MFKELNEKMDGLQATVTGHHNRLTSLEENAETLHQRLEREASCGLLKADNQRLQAKLTDLEGRSRRSNVWLIGLPEGIEGPQPTKFFSQLLKEALKFFLLPRSRIGRTIAWLPGQALGAGRNLYCSVFATSRARSCSSGSPEREGH